MATTPTIFDSCDERILCPGSDYPVSNYSSEASDGPEFIFMQWPGNGGQITGSGGGVDCLGIGESLISLASAQLCAALSSATCGDVSSDAGCIPSIWPIGSGSSTKFFFNTLQSISGVCISVGGTQSLFVSTAPAGRFAALSQARADAIALLYAQHNFETPCCINSPKMQGNAGWCCLGADLDFTPQFNTYLVTGQNSGSDFTFTVTGNLPPGTTLDKATHNSAILGGVPTTCGFYTYTVQAVRTDLPWIYTEVTDTFAVFGITNATLPDGDVGTPYLDGTDPVKLLSAGGTAPVTFTAPTPADLPPGLTLASDGTISGTPTTDGQFAFDVTFTDAEGGVCTQEVTIEVIAAGLDWSTLVWDTVLFGGGDIAFGSAAGANLIWDLHGAADGSTSAFLTLHASLTYTGPAVNCKVAVTLTAGNAFTTLAFGILQDGNPVLSVAESGPPPGSTNYTFSLIAGTASVIEFQTAAPFAGPILAAAANTFLSFPAGILDGGAIISNVP